MAADFTPLAQVLKAKLPVAPTSHDTAHFAPVSVSTPPRSSDTTILSPSQSSAHGATNIELKRDGDRISQIRVHCRCGELIEIDCEY